MDIYRLIKIYHLIESPRLKLLGILALHLLKKRYLNMVFDPVLSCNLRCKMCYFSDPESRKNLHGVFSDDDIQAIAKALFYRVIRLQIGCGAEPTVYKKLPELITIAHQHGIQNISLTTNGNLLTYEKLRQMASNGLNEIILSAHGFTKNIYEELMTGGKFELFKQTLENIGKLRQESFPHLRLRINYTINEDNVKDLPLIADVFSSVKPNVIQLRPIQKIGDSEYNNFSMDEIISQYDKYITPVVAFCDQNGITCLYPKKENITAIDTGDENTNHINSVIDMLPYFQLSPFDGWKDKINPYKETFEDYSKRNHRISFIIKHLLGIKCEDYEKGVTKSLNYHIK